jgi:hypothetical protein
MNSTTEIVRTGAMLAYALLIVAFGFSGYYMINSIIRANDSFDRVGEIVAAGASHDLSDDSDLIEESYEASTSSEVQNPAPETSNVCYVGGCSSQICSDQPDVISTCEWRVVYACYVDAECERQADGECGWTMNAELQSCINRTK